MRWLLLCAVVGCVSSNSQVCDFGVCPNATACDEMHHLCVDPTQLTACRGLDPGAACMVGTLAGHCIDDVCLPTVCADGVVEPGEMCDDGNTAAGDGCSADCSSDLTCGNGVVDAARGEECDDHNLIDHDGCSSTCLIETPEWIEHSLVPPGRQEAASAYDTHRDRVVMFGGNDTNPGGGMRGDTWEWNGGEWLHIPTAVAPSARVEAAMSYDAGHATTVLFGGQNVNTIDGDTWTWDGAAWTPHDILDGPSGRAGAAVAYDNRRGRIVMFGGFDFAAGDFDETWEWDGAHWTQALPAHVPPKRKFASAAYDPVRGVVVLTGGVHNPPNPPYNDTWVFDGVDWREVTPSGSRPQIIEAAMAWDTSTQRVLLFGGLNGSIQSTLWAWNGSAWNTVTPGGPALPSARLSPVFAGDGEEMVLFGGGASGGSSGETWLLANNAWSQPVDIGPRANFSMVNEVVNGRAILHGGNVDSSLTRSGETWAITQASLSRVANAPPSPRLLSCLTYDYAHHTVVLFGGSTGTTGGGTPNAETWIWNGAGWQQRIPTMSPAPRVDAACAFDGARVTLFGGLVGGNPAGDAWTWDGTTWAPVAVPSALPARYGAAANYDPIRRRMVLFGGLQQTTPFDDTWTYDGTTATWAQQAPDGFRPSGRWDSAMAWNAARQALVLVGGLGGSTSVVDAYEWDGTKWHEVPTSNAPQGRSACGIMSSLDGGGVLVYGGNPFTSASPFKDRWELRWDARHPSESCNSADSDGDGRIACADPDCWAICTPTCPPGTTCDPAAVRCGDGICDPNRETCRSCPTDCTCAPACGDGICDPGETCAGDCP